MPPPPAIFFSLVMLWLTGPGTAVNAQTVSRPECDSLPRVLTGSKADTNRVNVLRRLGEKDHLLTQQERRLEEKERLLEEIRHRVKNNLQIVMSLLNSQANTTEDMAALSAIQESQHRVQTMALIHQKLYQAEGVARIPMQAYIEEVMAYLSDSYSLSQPVRFELEADQIQLDVTQAVTLGLINNEAITNDFKYDFPDGRSGRIKLSLQQLKGTIYQLSLADDGVGLLANYDSIARF